MNSNFIAGEFYFDAAQAPPFGLEQRLTNVQFDDPWRSAGRANPYPLTGAAGTQFPDYALLIQTPKDLKTTRVHNWNVAVQRQVGENMAMSATYIANRLVNVWGDVTGNPGLLPATNPTGPCTLQNPTAPGGVQTYPNCSLAPLDVRREITQSNPSVGRFIGYLDWVTDSGWQRYHGILLQAQRRSARGLSTTANYTWSTCRGLVSQGGAPLNVGTGYTRPVSLVNPPANPQALFDTDEGPCSNSPTHIFNLTASAATPEFGGKAMRMLASGWRLSGIFRAQSGDFLTVTTGLLHSTGVQATTARANQVGNDPYGARTLSNWLSPTAFAQPAPGEFGNSGRNAYQGPGRRVVDLSLVRSFRMGTQRLDARVEAFNALNWFQWGSPITNFSDANFGRILTLAGDPRVMQFALKYSF